LPPRHLETLLRALVRAKILNSACGPSGGYRLARGSRLISAGEIVRTCTVKKAPDASRLISKVVEASLQKAGESAMANLDTITIEDICYQAAAVGIKENDEIPLGLKKAKP
jgi:DNA-binding IscR family transcriptional regulator